MSQFHTASDTEITSGKITDVYFQRTHEILKELGNTSHVTMEVRAAGLPKDYEFAILAGIEEVSKLFEGKPVDVEALAEGSFFIASEPVLTVNGRAIDPSRYETALLGLLCQASGIATRAARCKKAVEARPSSVSVQGECTDEKFEALRFAEALGHHLLAKCDYSEEMPPLLKPLLKAGST